MKVRDFVGFYNDKEIDIKVIADDDYDTFLVSWCGMFKKFTNEDIEGKINSEKFLSKFLEEATLAKNVYSLNDFYKI